MSTVPVAQPERIVYFDGYCNLCNSAVEFLIRHDHKRVLKYASLQGHTASRRLPPGFSESLISMVFQKDNRLWKESSAALHSVIALGGMFRLAYIAFLVPPSLRDVIYKWVATNRYQWFGKRETCRLPTPEERALFLD